MSDSVRNSQKHIKLFLPGPVEVLPEILDAQAGWMIGHRMPEALELIGRIKPKLQQVFRTEQRVLFQSGTGSGFWEAAARCAVGKKVLHCTSGAFSDKWVNVTKAVGKEYDVIEFEWGQPVLPAPIIEKLKTGDYDALAIVHNETSTGITNPIQEIAAAVRALPNGEDISILVDCVSGMSGVELRFDDWDIDMAFCSSQKAFAMPPGLASLPANRASVLLIPTPIVSGRCTSSRTRFLIVSATSKARPFKRSAPVRSTKRSSIELISMRGVYSKAIRAISSRKRFAA